MLPLNGYESRSDVGGDLLTKVPSAEEHACQEAAALTTSMRTTGAHDDRTTSAARECCLRVAHAGGCASPLLYLVTVREYLASCVHRGQSSAYDLAVNDDTLYPPFAVGDSVA